MLALVKTAEGPGLELREWPDPTVGINDVLIRVRKTGICGTDLHIYAWDAWAQKTIRVPMVIGHEFVGRDRRGRLERERLRARRPRQRRGPRRLRPLPQLHGRPAPPLRAHDRASACNRPGAFAEYVALPMTNVWHHWPGIDEDVAAIFDPFGNAVHTALVVPGARRGRADHRRRPDRLHGGRGRAPRRRAPRRRHRPEPVPAASSRRGWARRSRSTRASATSPRSSASSA